MIDLNNVGFVLASKYRKLIMESLLDGQKTIKEISDEGAEVINFVHEKWASVKYQFNHGWPIRCFTNNCLFFSGLLLII